MILIFSTKDDISTHTVMDWLIYNNQTPILINELNPIVDIKVTISDEEEDLWFVTKSGENVFLENVKVVWYRRGFNFLEHGFLPSFKPGKDYEIILQNIKNEYSSLIELMFSLLKPKTIGDFSLTDPNKQKILLKAKNAGFCIPKTIICTSQKNSFNSQHVSKNITNIINIQLGNSLFYNRTTLQKRYSVKKFFPSLFQEYINKKHELRVFFFLDRIYPMLITSGKGSSLKTDIREISGRDSLVKCPVNIPVELKLKIRSFIKNSEYSSGSIDLIVDENNKVFFLELNPTGQFYYVSLDCGYNIEKEIADKLHKYEKEGFNRYNWFRA